MSSVRSTIRSRSAGTRRRKGPSVSRTATPWTAAAHDATGFDVVQLDAEGLTGFFDP